jgi:predicted transcriptional regulator of viral defense system
MQKGDYLDSILRSNKTIFTLKDIALLWQDSDTDSARVRLHYYVKKGNLLRLRRGIYVKDQKYDKLELATRVFTPSYISFETVLAKESLIFQYHTDITVASYLSRKISIDEQTYSYRKMKDSILADTTGIEHKNNVALATKERAFLDTLYNNTDYHFDNLRSLDWEVVNSLLELYSNKRVAKKVNQLYKESTE